MSTVTRIDQSPMNAQRWCLQLSCGHEEWLTAKRKPKKEKFRCSRCELTLPVATDAAGNARPYGE